MSEERMVELDTQIKAELERIEAKKVAKSDRIDEAIGETQIDTIDSKTPEQSKDDYYDEAVKMGWNPNYTGVNKKDAKRFVEDKSFFDKIAAQNRKIDELSHIVAESLNHTTKLEKAAYDKALRDLEQAKLKAVSEADLLRYNTIMEQEKLVKSQAETLTQTVRPPISITDAQRAFMERNKDWFNKNTPENADMSEDADYIDKRIAKQLAREGKVISQAEHLQLVEEAIKKQYSHRFINENQHKPNLVGSSTLMKTESKQSNLISRLSDQQKELFRTGQKYGSKLTLEAYAKQLELTGDLK